MAILARPNHQPVLAAVISERLRARMQGSSPRKSRGGGGARVLFEFVSTRLSPASFRARPYRSLTGTRHTYTYSVVSEQPPLLRYDGEFSTPGFRASVYPLAEARRLPSRNYFAISRTAIHCHLPFASRQILSAGIIRFSFEFTKIVLR